MLGSAVLSDAMAATTAARARHTTAVITPWRIRGAWGVADIVSISLSVLIFITR
jgi:hypothetical protein